MTESVCPSTSQALAVSPTRTPNGFARKVFAEVVDESHRLIPWELPICPRPRECRRRNTRYEPREADRPARRARLHDRASAAEAIDGLDAQGLITTSDQGTIELTSQGKALSDNVIAVRHELRKKLYGNIPSEDIATTNRVLDTIQQRATAVQALQ
jgi:hypothetical protein